MSITIDKLAITTRMTTLSRVRDELSISSQSTADASLRRYIDEASDQVVQIAGRPFAQQTYIENFRSVGRNTVDLTHGPLVDIQNLTYDVNNVITSTTYQVDDYEIPRLYRRDGWVNTQMFRIGVELEPLQLTDAEQLWQIKYTAGYLMPEQTSSTLSTSSTAAPISSTGPKFPRDLESAVVDIVVSRWQMRGQNRLVRQTKAGESYESYIEDEMSPYALKIVRRWSRAF